MPLSASQYRAIVIAEKVSSTFSVIGALFVITTFLLNTRFRKPINRLVFFAAWGNLFANAATLISRSGIELGADSSLCQCQAFLIQWTLPADALWTSAMACNVYLSFFHHFDAATLRKQEWKYFVCCYGLPLCPALVYLFVKSADKGRIYGSAELWCWVSSEWNILRIATFYGPVWIFILINIAIYLRVGIIVFKWRRNLMTMALRTEASFAAQSSESSAQSGQTRGSMARKDSQVGPSGNAPRSNSMATSEQDPRAPDFEWSARFSRRASRPVERVERHKSISQTIDANKAAINYCKCALLFFVALLITWFPSTCNRVYSFAHPHKVNFGLEFVAALVLPLQGFWNMIIYMATSLVACDSMMQDAKVVIKKRMSSVGLPWSPRRESHIPALTVTRMDSVFQTDCKNSATPHDTESGQNIGQGIDKGAEHEHGIPP